MSTTEIVPQELTQTVLPLPLRADQISIADQASYDDAAEFLKRLVALRKKITDTFGPLKEKAFQSHRAIVEEEKRHLSPVAEAERVCKTKIAVWNQEQERLRQEEQRRLRDAARQREEEDRLAAAVAAEDAGVSPEEVEAILEQPTPVVTPRVSPTYAAASGISTRESWRGEVTSLLALVKYVAANPHFLNLLMVNQPGLNALARAQKSTLAIPGVQAVCEKNTAVRI